jgi:hypothetical protein
MRLHDLTLVNFRGFEQLSLTLDPEVTVVIGENGAGKTALVDALAIAAANVAPPGVHRPLPGAADIRRSIADGRLTYDVPLVLGWTQVLDDTHVGGRLRVDSPPVANAVAIDLRSPPTDRWKTASSLARAGTPMVLPVLARYSVDRRWGWEGWHEVGLQARESGYENWDIPEADANRLVGWIRRQTYADLQAGAPSIELVAVQQAVAAAVGGVRDIFFDIRGDEMRARLTDGRVLPLAMLSAGYRVVVALVADLAWRCVALNGHLGVRATEQTPGIVLIDEIELHLHPAWQRRVIDDLRRVFPLMQFVITTHSPQVLASARSSWVRVLRQKSVQTVNYVEGRDSNSLLEDVFGIDERPPRFKQRLHELFVAIDQGRLKDAENLASELRLALGPDDPDLTRAAFLLDMA